MKTIKTTLLLALSMCLMFNISSAQEDKSVMYSIHTDNVNFNKLRQYEAAAKELNDLFTEHNIQSTSWSTFSIEDGRYIYSTQIENFADLDNNFFAEFFEKVGEETASKLLDKMDECYDSHSNSIMYYLPELSYHPEGYSTDGKNHREYHFMYYAPKNAKAMKEAMKAVKDMFVSKGVKNGYTMLHSGFGSEESFYMVSISAEDDESLAKSGKANDETLGDERKATFFNVISLTSKYDVVKGTYRPDLSYQPTED